MTNTKKTVLFVVSLPLLVIGVVFDIVKLPIVVVFFIPTVLYLLVINRIKNDHTLKFWETIKVHLLLGTAIYWELVWDYEII